MSQLVFLDQWQYPYMNYILDQLSEFNVVFANNEPGPTVTLSVQGTNKSKLDKLGAALRKSAVEYPYGVHIFKSRYREHKGIMITFSFSTLKEVGYLRAGVLGQLQLPGTHPH